MKRQLNFDFENGKYVLKENDAIIFSIDGKDLKFVSLDFYNGVYKNKSTAIDLAYIISDDEFKKGRYIFTWLEDIVISIQSNLNELEIDTFTNEQNTSESMETVVITKPKLLTKCES